MFDSLLMAPSAHTEIDLNDPWVGTPFEGYVFMSPKQKGESPSAFRVQVHGEYALEVKRAATSTAGHDRVIDDIIRD